MWVGIIAVLLIFYFAIKGRKQVEEFCKAKELPSGKKIPLYKWVVASLALALSVFLVTYSIGYLLLTLIVVSWGGPYLHYALAWNFNREKEVD